MRAKLLTVAMVSLLAPACDGAEVETMGDFRGAGTCEGRAGEPGILARRALVISGTPVVEGPNAYLYSGGDVTVSGNAEINGDIDAGGSLTRNGNPTITGTVNEGAYVVGVQSAAADADKYATNNDNDNIVCDLCTGQSGTDMKLTGRQSLTLSSGNYYFTSISISGKAQLKTSGNVVVYLDGPATINGGSTTNPDTDTFTLVSMSTEVIRINGSSAAAMHIFAPDAQVQLSGTSDFIGSVVGDVVKLSGTAALYLTHGSAGSGDACPGPGDPNGQPSGREND